MEANQAKAKQYRERAEEVRAIAEAIMETECRKSLLRIAAAYEQMAETFDPNTATRLARSVSG